jgi:glycosyltransferase involved in cell wall biosynthesis
MKDIVESVSIIIPAYQEGAVIGGVVSGVLRVAGTLGCDYEVIVVDDGSTDGTGAAARQAGAHVLTHPYNKGYGASLKTGIRFSTSRTVIFLDADGQHDPNDIPRLLAERRAYDMVVGARKGTAGSPLWRKPGKAFLGRLANQLTGRKIADLNSGYRATDRQMATRFLPIMPDGFSFSTTSTIAAFRGGYLVHYVPIEVAKRVGKSTVTAADGFRTIMLIIRLVTLFAPLRVFLPISALTFLIGLYFTIYGYVHVGEASVKGLIALLAAVQFFLFGIMVDQLVAVRRGETIGRK